MDGSNVVFTFGTRVKFIVPSPIRRTPGLNCGVTGVGAAGPSDVAGAAAVGAFVSPGANVAIATVLDADGDEDVAGADSLSSPHAARTTAKTAHRPVKNPARTAFISATAPRTPEVVLPAGAEQTPS